MKYNRPRKAQRLPPKITIHLITEGTKTEARYFLWFKSNRYVLKFHNNNRNLTSPKGLVERAKIVEKENDLLKSDQIWIISDKDNWTNEHFDTLKRWIDNVKHYHALSNPCFEIWILFHFENSNVTSAAECINRLKKYIPNYDKNFDRNVLTLRMIETAVERAKKRYQNNDNNCFDFTGSTVFKLVEMLLKD